MTRSWTRALLSMVFGLVGLVAVVAYLARPAAPVGVGGAEEPPEEPGFLPDPWLWMSWQTARLYEAVAEAMQGMTRLPQVWKPASARELYVTVDGITWASYGLVIAAAGLILATYHTLHMRHSLSELAPRLVVGGLGASLGAWVITQLVEYVNAIIDALPTVSTDELFEHFTYQDYEVFSLTEFLMILAVLVVILVMCVDAIMRIVVLLLLYVTAPAALACHALPHTEGLAYLWWRLCGAVAASAIGQALVVGLWLKAAATDESQTFLGISMTRNGIMRMILMIVLGLAVHKIHVHVFRWARASTGRSLLRTLVMGAVVRGGALPRLPGRGGPGGGPSSPGGPGGPGGGGGGPYDGGPGPRPRDVAAVDVPVPGTRSRYGRRAAADEPHWATVYKPTHPDTNGGADTNAPRSGPDSPTSGPGANPRDPDRGRAQGRSVSGSPTARRGETPKPPSRERRGEAGTPPPATRRRRLDDPKPPPNSAGRPPGVGPSSPPRREKPPSPSSSGGSRPTPAPPPRRPVPKPKPPPRQLPKRSEEE